LINKNWWFIFSGLLFIIFILTSCVLNKKEESVSNSAFKVFTIDGGVYPQLIDSNTTQITFKWKVKPYCSTNTYEVDIYLSRDTKLDESDMFLTSVSSKKQSDSITLYSGDSDFDLLKEGYAGRYYVIYDTYCSNVGVHTAKVVSPIYLKAKWTVLIYMDGDNSLSSYTDLDLNEMIQVGSSRNVAIVTQVDTYGSNGVKRYFINPNEKVLLENLKELNMGDPQTLIDFGKWGVKNFPADHYLLILWNHGKGFKRAITITGIRRDICTDVTSGDSSLSIPELNYALSAIKNYIGKKIDVIGMDACLMNMIEVGYEIRDTAEYLVASENTEPGNGWPYDKMLLYLKQNPSIDAEALAKSMVQNFGSVYNVGDEATLSAVKLDTLSSVISSLNALSKTLITDLKNDTTGTLKSTILTKVVANVQRFNDLAEDTITSKDSYVDLYDFALLISQNFLAYSALASNLMRAINATVIANVNTGGSVANAYGLSIWLPNFSVYQQYKSLYDQLSFTNDTYWEEFFTLLF